MRSQWGRDGETPVVEIKLGFTAKHKLVFLALVDYAGFWCQKLSCVTSP